MTSSHTFSLSQSKGKETLLRNTIARHDHDYAILTLAALTHDRVKRARRIRSIQTHARTVSIPVEVFPTSIVVRNSSWQ